MSAIASRAARGALALGLTAGLLGGCAHQPPPPVDIAAVKTLGVYSFCGQSIRRETKTWITIGLDTSSDLKVMDWALDAHIFTGIRAKAPAGMAVIPVHLDTALAVEGVVQKTKSTRDLAWTLLFAADQPRKDAYLVIFPILAGTYWEDEQARISQYYHDNQHFGFGIFSRARSNELYASCGAFLYDAKQRQIVRRYGFRRLEDVPDGLLKDRWSDYSEADIAQVRAAMEPLATTYGGDLMAMILADPENATPSPH